MKKSYIFPGQGAQFVGMGKDLYDQYPQAKAMFEEANNILGFRITDLMFFGTDEDLRQTKVTQPAVFLHSVISAMVARTDVRASGVSTPLSDRDDCSAVPTTDNLQLTTDKLGATNGDTENCQLSIVNCQSPDMVAGHSLGEFSALVVAGALSFTDGLRLVYARALAMQKACELEPSTMAAILGLDDDVVERICDEITTDNLQLTTDKLGTVNGDTENCQLSIVNCQSKIVVPANYNSPGQLVISGTLKGVEIACEKLKEAGAKRALPLKVGGAFHSPLMQPASDELQKAIEQTTFKTPICPIYQNVDAKPHTDPEIIKRNLILQLTAPVRWRGIVENMLADGGTDCKSAPAIASTGSATDAIEFTEFGPGNVLMGLIGKIRG